MDPKALRAAALKAAQDLIEGAKSAGRQMTDDERATVQAKFTEVESLDKQIAQAKADEDLGAKVFGLTKTDDNPDDGDQTAAKSLGEHFVKSVGTSGLARVKTEAGSRISAPEFKAAVTQSTPASLAPFLTDYDRTIVRAFRRPVVSDLLGSGSISGNAVTYLVEGSAIEGGFTTVAEGGAKPQFSVADPTTVTDSLKKIAGFLKFTDEMIEDADFWVSEINNRGLYLLALAEENQLLNGPGTGSTILGLLNRGISTEAAATALGGADNADAVFRAITKVQTDTGLSADGVIVNPADYQSFRLSKDGNGQYFGGGFFNGQYGNGGIQDQPPLWGLRTVVSSAVAAGTAVVGAFSAASTVYRKGGIRVESTNSHDVDFTSNLVTTRIEERVALAVRIPKAFVKVTLDYTPVPAA